MLCNKKLNPTELFITRKKLNISVFATQPNKRELQQIAFNHSSDIDFRDFMNFYKNVLQNHVLF